MSIKIIFIILNFIFVFINYNLMQRHYKKGNYQLSIYGAFAVGFCLAASIGLLASLLWSL